MGTLSFASRLRTVQRGRQAVVALLLAALSSLLLTAYASAQVTWPDVTLEQVEDGFTQPVHVTAAHDGSNRLFVVERAGRIQIIQNGAKLSTPFLDIHERVGSDCSECGLLSVAFPPDFAEQGYFFVYYTSAENRIGPDEGDRDDDGTQDPDGTRDTVVARFQVLAGDPNRADPKSEATILLQNQPARNHNGGQLAFGPDDMLYIGLGDGGGGGDTYKNAQKLSSLLGKILRIQVGASGTYTVPNDNPFVGQANVRPEIWAYGLRNPWRFAFDRATGDLYIGDVGQGTYEEIDFQPAASSGGENYGWNKMEGLHCYPIGSSACDPDSYVLPIAEYNHSSGDCSVSGGVVYAAKTPGQASVYLYGDWCSGRIRALQRDGNDYATTTLLDTELAITSFGQDEAGDSYVVDFNGAVYRFAEEVPALQHRLVFPLLRRD